MFINHNLLSLVLLELQSLALDCNSLQCHKYHKFYVKLMVLYFLYKHYFEFCSSRNPTHNIFISAMFNDCATNIVRLLVSIMIKFTVMRCHFPICVIRTSSYLVSELLVFIFYNTPLDNYLLLFIFNAFCLILRIIKIKLIFFTKR